MKSQKATARWIDPSLDPMTRYHACKAMARGLAESRKTDGARLGLARAFCAAVVESFWHAMNARHGARLRVKALDLTLPRITNEARQVAEDAGRLIADFPAEDAGFLIGSIYTVMLPTALRSELGAYYTPPPLVSRLLDLAQQAGFDFAKGTAIDPACGGGAFLAPLAMRMIANASGESPSWTLKRLGKRLRGIELDPFAAWMTRVLLEAAILPLCVAAKSRLDDVVIVANALTQPESSTFDLVIGNPPYGRVSLDEAMRDRYARSLYGHANLYGLFTDLALRLAKPGGVIAYLTPTSFLGGQYFKALRRVVSWEATVKAIDIVSDRNGVFDDVLQETLLATYIRAQGTPGDHGDAVGVSLLIPQGLHRAKVERVGYVRLEANGDPWLLPRSEGDVAFLSRLASMPTRMADIGYGISTGPLVWNRHRSQLRNVPAKGVRPLIWAESVGPCGFAFASDRRNHVPYIEVWAGQDHLVTQTACVLVQRTTSKEQQRRLLAAVMPQSFLDEANGAVVENHLNMIYPKASSTVAPSTIAALLNTAVVDRAFRCISGSVAVSAYELNALPLPSMSQLKSLERLIARGATTDGIERKVASFYGEP